MLLNRNDVDNDDDDDDDVNMTKEKLEICTIIVETKREAKRTLPYSSLIKHDGYRG